DLPDPRTARFNQRSVGLHLHLFVHGSDLQRDIDRRTAADLQDNSRLDISAESRPGSFEAVRTHRKVCERVAAIGAAGCVSDQPGFRLSGFDLSAGHGKSGSVLHYTADLRRRYSLGKNCGTTQYKAYRNANDHHSQKTPLARTLSDGASIF